MAATGLAFNEIAGDVSICDALRIAGALAEKVPRGVITFEMHHKMDREWSFILLSVVAEALSERTMR